MRYELIDFESRNFFGELKTLILLGFAAIFSQSNPLVSSRTIRGPAVPRPSKSQSREAASCRVGDETIRPLRRSHFSRNPQSSRNEKALLSAASNCTDGAGHEHSSCKVLGAIV
jgi:hypothetical protein